jgi:hypothetical protein
VPAFHAHTRPADLSAPQFVIPENAAHAFLTALFLLCGQFTAFLLNLPLVLFNANKCVFGVCSDRS